ncbi:hypothetical protein DL770_005179 [Monosporascus sp. CRB-9-2]|nr:hypothetical protein DL770_005179 [Monosporascus sp. CRB-9-2]
MASIHEDQINLQQTASHSYTVSYPNDWTHRLPYVFLCTVVVADDANLEFTLALHGGPHRLAPASPKPAPDFDRVLAHQPDEHWLPAHLAGEIFPINRHQLILNPRDRFPVDGMYDAWSTPLDGERMDATCL